LVFFEVIKIIGALGLFIYGMMVMSDGIQKLGGQRMRKVLSSITSNRFKGVFTGFSTTALLQSSSVTTLMIVSFVNAGLLSLRQSIGVIMGANIGTTMTAWLLVLFGFSSFSIGAYAFPILALAVPLLFFKREAIKDIGEFLLGFSLLFLGLETMKETVEGLGLAKNDTFLSVIGYLKEQGYIGILLLVLVGTITTAVVQSSSAAMALTLSLCGTMGLPFEMAAALVLGENIGTTITANLGALVGNSSAKRAARAHFLFNLVGVCWMLLVFRPFIHGIASWMESTVWGNPFTEATDDSIRYSLSAFHTAFNILNTLFLIGFIPYFERILNRWFANKGGDDDAYRLEYIGNSVMSTAEVSLIVAKKEVSKYAGVLMELHHLVVEQTNSVDAKEKKALLKKIKVVAGSTQTIHKELSSYLTKLINKDITDSTSAKVRLLLSMVNDLETISTVYVELSNAIKQKSEDKIWFNQSQREALNKLYSELEPAFYTMEGNIDSEWNAIDINALNASYEAFKQLHAGIKIKHLKAIAKQKYSYKSGAVINTLFNGLEKISSHIHHISLTLHSMDTE
jgi:phosphate:Na+ symporter